MARGNLINVRPDARGDQYYRYKMEPLQTKVEGKGNGIKTVIVNLPNVAEHLTPNDAHSANKPFKGRWILKYFGFEIGAQTSHDKTNDRWIINGAHESAKLQELLDGFIKKFVLCPKCHSPETILELTPNKKSLISHCQASGCALPTPVGHKLYGFILKELNEEAKRLALEQKAAQKAARKAGQNGAAKDDAKDSSANGGNDGDQSGSGNEAQDDAGGDIELAKLQAEAADLEISSEPKEETWASNTSAEAVKARQAELSGGLEAARDVDEEDIDYVELGEWIGQQAEELGGIDNVGNVEIFHKAKTLEIEHDAKTIQVLVQAIFNENIVQQVPKRVVLFKQILAVESDSDATREELEMDLIGGTERLLGSYRKTKPEIFTHAAKILQLYYNEDLLSEEVALLWEKRGPSSKYAKSSISKKVHEGAKPFLDWLKEADEESEEESDEDED